jgi:MarC family integral membrane protein
MAGSLLVGALVLKVYGISVPVLRVAGGSIVAAAGWTLLNEGTQKEGDAPPPNARKDYTNQAFYPLTLPLTTGPGTNRLCQRDADASSDLFAASAKQQDRDPLHRLMLSANCERRDQYWHTDKGSRDAPENAPEKYCE